MRDFSGTTKVLVVDDDPATRDIIRLSLSPLGYHVSEAVTGTEVLEKVIIENPDIIVLDVMLPEKSGLEVCHYLKESAITAHLPIILLTAKQDLADHFMGYQDNSFAAMLGQEAIHSRTSSHSYLGQAFSLGKGNHMRTLLPELIESTILSLGFL